MPKGIGMSPGFVVQVGSNNPKNYLCKKRPQQHQYYWNTRTRNTLFLWRQLLHFLASLTPGILSHLLSLIFWSAIIHCSDQSCMHRNTYIPQCQNGMTWWQMIITCQTSSSLPSSSFNKSILLDSTCNKTLHQLLKSFSMNADLWINVHFFRLGSVFSLASIDLHQQANITLQH